MTTLSVLRNIKEINDVKVKLLPLPNPPQVMYADTEWVITEYTNWAKQYPNYRHEISDMLVLMGSQINIKCKSKERILNVIKAQEIGFIIHLHLEASRRERSPEMAEQVIHQLIETVKAGKCDDNFIPGKRLIESLKNLRTEVTAEQLNIIDKLLESSFKAHLEYHCDYYLKNQFIPLKDYVSKRLFQSCWHYTIFFSEYAVDYAVPKDIRNNELVKRLGDKLVELALGVDDYYLTVKKIISNDNTTRIISYLNENGGSLQEAFDNHFEYVMALHQECTQLIEKITANPELNSDKLKDWLFTKFNYIYCLYNVLKVALNYQLNDDKTLRSEVLDQLYNKLVANQSGITDKWFL